MKAQREFFKNRSSEYGGDLRKRRRGRVGGRPLATRSSMFVTLKSTQAVGPWAFNTERNRPILEALVQKFAKKFAVQIYSLGNAGNHCHIHLKLTNRMLYRGFICALSAALTIAITGHCRWNKVLAKAFFDHRPHTRIVAAGKKSFRIVEDYNRINDLEGLGAPRGAAEKFVRLRRKMMAGSA